jgi:predicted dehydrogenase
VNAAANTIIHNHPKTAPDHVFVQGILESGALASLSFRTVNSTIDGVGIRWLISGTEGEIEITTPEMLWQLRVPGWTLKIKKGKGETKDVEFSIPEENYPGSFLGINTARLYEAYANQETDKFADFKGGLATHYALQRILRASK